MYQLSQKYDFYQTQGVLGPVQMDDGAYTVTPSLTPSGTLQLTSVGTLKDGYSRTVKATVHVPGLEQVHRLGRRGSVQHRCRRNVLWRHPLQRRHQQLRCRYRQGNRWSWQDLYMEHHPKAVNYPGGAWNDQPAVNFAQLTNDLATMKVTAQAAGAYYPLSGAKGYEVVLNGPQATIYKITDIATKPSVATSTTPYGTLTKVLVGTAAIPSDGVFFFDDNVWVTGNYSAKVTVATSKSVICPGDIRPDGLRARPSRAGLSRRTTSCSRTGTRRCLRTKWLPGSAVVSVGWSRPQRRHRCDVRRADAPEVDSG